MLTVQRFTFNPVQENTYVVYNEKGAACIIDPGCYFAQEEQELIGFLKNQALEPVLLLNTHCHFDHIFGNRLINKTFGLELHLHPLEEKILQFGPVSSKMWQMEFENYDGPLHFLNEGATVAIGNDQLEVLFTPGHSPGSICFYSSADGFIIGGDVLFKGSIGRTDLPGGSFETLEQSIKAKLYSLPPEVIVYPGHGDATTIGAEMRSNPFVKG
ncbi:MAG: MBL fold metallo-hydrolase [Flavisolibacter sp.]|jgi:glyoxylase-like metal-dependent hydrolase (beta-lactamase superfamily II)|nr:MBL fold metallo-hydrolase [Flavisolibacter sp.]